MTSMPDSVQTNGEPRLLAVFAHPDDEEWGTSGALVACVERGIEVHVLSATSGEAGEISAPVLATPETLAAVREEELRSACRILGLAEPILLGHPDGGLADVDRDLLVAQIVAAIRRLRPLVVLTFDANGAYGHPDHVAIHRASVAAVDLAADPAYRLPPEVEDGPPHCVGKLYATAYPHSLSERINAGFAAAGLPPIDFGEVQTVATDAIGTPDTLVTTVVPVDRHWDRCWAAFLAHRTQYGPDNPFVAVGEPVVRGWLATNSFRRLRPAPAPGAALPDEDDLWAGLPLPAQATAT
jgi:N-acetyl-1-D-myo-inositol-2-amino-2-deoxy-alpha-D-glucopyranoside deacetylase